MRNSSYSTVDPETGSVNYTGPSEVMKGDHSHMPGRTSAYLPDDERGHVQASSLGGVNDRSNVVPQNRDVNHKGYASMERGERDALKDATVQSDKTAYASNQAGARPDAFMVNDTVTYADGHTETIHHSFANESYADQEARNAQTAAMPDTFDAPNPGDTLRESMSSQEYSDLMEETDASLPSIADDYAPADFSGAPSSADSWNSDIGAESDSTVDTDSTASADPGDDGADPDGDGGADPGDDGGASSDPD